MHHNPATCWKICLLLQNKTLAAVPPAVVSIFTDSAACVQSFYHSTPLQLSAAIRINGAATLDHSRFQRPRLRQQQTTETTPASQQHNQRPATSTTNIVPQLTTPASHQHHRHRPTLKETPSGSGSTAPCTVCCVPCLRSRNPGGLERKVHRKDMPTTTPFVSISAARRQWLESDSDNELHFATAD